MEIPKSIAIGLVKAQRAAKDVEKDGTNAHFKYKYASADAIAAEARAALNGAGLALCRIGWTPVPAVLRNEWEFIGDPGDAKAPGWMEPWIEPARILVTYAVVAESDGAVWVLDPVSVPVLPEKGRPEDKAEAAALTYSAGYVALGLLQIERVDQHSPDARDDSNRQPGRQQQRPAQQQTQQRAQERPAGKFPEDPMTQRQRTPMGETRNAEEFRAWILSWGKAAMNAGQLDRMLEHGANLEVDTATVKGWLGI
jgi:hypothetical protein